MSLKKKIEKNENVFGTEEGNKMFKWNQIFNYRSVHPSFCIASIDSNDRHY